MQLKSLLSLLVLILLIGACSKVEIDGPQEPQQDPIPKAELNAFIIDQLHKTGPFHWSQASDEQLWSAVVQSDSLIAIGYTLENLPNLDETIHLIDIQKEEWQKVKNDILDYIVSETNRLNGTNVTAEDLMPLGQEARLPFLMIKVHNASILKGLRQMPTIRYVDAVGYVVEEVADRSSAGCDVEPDFNIPAADYTTVSPNVKVPWNFYNANIPAAWNTTSGDGVTIALIDTGTSPTQSKLGSAFNSGQSQGRFIDREGTYVSSWWWWASPDGPDDKCGHGTQMSGLLAAPRGYGGSSVGVAYNSDLLAIRGTSDVVILGSKEVNGVSDAVEMAGARSDVKVLSMSIGSIFYFGSIADAINYAHGQGKMIVAAAGTSTWFTSWVGVVFPASMGNTVAVTGVKEQTPLVKCNTCHSGSAVDFVAVMQRDNDNSRTSLTLAMSGNTPARVGGSSCATAMTAGIAALVWSTNPNQSRTQVLQRMKDASQFYPARDNKFGWGKIDADLAVK